MATTAEIGLNGKLASRTIRPDDRKRRERQIAWAIRGWRVKHFFKQRWREIPLEFCLLAIRALQHLVPGLNLPMHGRLYRKIYRNAQLLFPGFEFLGEDEHGLTFQDPAFGVRYSVTLQEAKRRGVEVWDYGLIGCHLVTAAGKAFVAGAFDATNNVALLKYHASGLGTTAAALGDVSLQTELTTQYAVANVRPTGSQAHATNTYTTVATLAPSATVAITEWGLMTQAGAGGGTLLDRQVFSAQNLTGGVDSQQNTYVLTIA